MIRDMDIIITMGGLGSRFARAGYTVPKYRIEAKGKTLFEWSLDSLSGYNAGVGKYVFIVRREDDAADFIREKCHDRHLDAIEIVELDHVTDGQATTALLGVERTDPHEPILIYNIDTYVEPFAMKLEDIHGDGHIPCFYGEGDHWSFVRLDGDRKVVEVKEKVRISDYCTLGAYYFSSGALYKELYAGYHGGDVRSERKERYIAPMYDYMVQQGMEVTMSLVDADKVHVLGTPEELQAFIGDTDTLDRSHKGALVSKKDMGETG